MNKFWYLVTYTLGKRVKTKAFLIANILVLLLVIFITILPAIIVNFSGEDATQRVVVFDNSNTDNYAFSALLEGQGVDSGFLNYVLSEISWDETDRELMVEGYTAAIYLYLDNGVIRAKIINDGLRIQNEIMIQNDLNTMKQRLWLLNNPDSINDINEFFAPIQTTFVSARDGDESAIVETALMIVAMAIIIPVFIMLIMIMNFVGMDILEEKSSRSVEVIVSNVKITHHFFSKIVSAFLFMLIQGVLLLGFTLIGLLVSYFIMNISLDAGGTIGDSMWDLLGIDSNIISQILARLPGVLFVSLIFVLAGYLFYLVLMAIFAAMATNMEDFAQFQSPVMLVLVAGFYAAIFSIPYGSNIFIRILGFIPLLSPLLAPALFISGAFGIIDVLISFILLVGVNVLLFYFGIPLYKVSILSYSQDSFFKRIKKLMKKSKYAE